MRCPGCDNPDTKVIESRDLDDGSVIRRRRQCPVCSSRFTTYERIEMPTVVVLKKDGRHELLCRDKLATGIYRALEKRPVHAEQVEDMISKIEREIRASGEPEIMSSKIGELVMVRLLEIDEVAYVRFSSVYRSFDSVDDFASELSKIRNR